MVVAIAVSLATVLASGVSSAVITYRLNRNKEHTFFMRKKAVELYLTTDEFGRELSGHMITLLSVVDGRITYNEALDLQDANPPQKAHGGAETMEMLVRIYFPEIEPQLEELFAARDEFAKIRSVHKAAYKEGAGDDKRFGSGFRNAIERVGAAIQTLKAAIVRSARHHANDTWFAVFSKRKTQVAAGTASAS